MLKIVRRKAGAIIMIGVASALVLGGVAAAQNESQSGSGGSTGARPGPPPALGPPIRGLTYAEFHLEKNGQEEVVRVDQGKITAVDSSLITLDENDGASVSVPLDQNTKVLGAPGHSVTIADLSEGESVSVSGPAGGTAKSIMVLPTGEQMKGTPPAGGQLPPPPPGAN